jgi:glycolate oxidase iron-sulfur subunit
MTGDAPAPAGPWQGLSDCVHCGLCLASCPTYLTTGVEMASPRGRLWLARALEDGAMGVSDAFVRHLDQCVGCLACQTACPSGVPYGHLLESARATIETDHHRLLSDRLVRFLLTTLFPYPARMGLALPVLAAYQRLGVSRLLRRSGILARIAPILAEAEGLLPPVPPRRERAPLPAVTPAVGPRKGRVGLLTGCIQRHLLPGINRATVRVLAAAGYEVAVPPDQGCCGAVHIHTGKLEEGRALARATIAAFDAARVEQVVANAGGCGAQMKDYGHLLAEDPAWRERAAAFSGAVRDVSELVAGAAWNGRLRPVPIAVTYHEACHLAHAQRIRQEPRAMLRQIPGLALEELAESDMCCGSGGVYNILQPEMARRLLARKIERIRATGASVVAAGNIGCLLQIRQGLETAKAPVAAVHPIEILDWSLNGRPGVERST